MPLVGAGAAQAAPLSEARLRAEVCGPGRLWTEVRVLPRTGSTNADALAAARAGQSEGLVIATEAQENGRGRLGRDWLSLPGSALTFSVLLRPAGVPPAALSWLPLLVGVAAAEALHEVAGVRARLKWPNDVLIGDGKLAGILAEQSGGAIVIGVGGNVLGGAAELPVATATSLELHGAGGTDRTELLAGMLTQIEHWYLTWRGPDLPGDADASGLRSAYLRLSATIGCQVRAELPGGRVVEGTAEGIDGSGRLLIWAGHGGIVPVSAGDVWHLR